jgi:hypothetical protein
VDAAYAGRGRRGVLLAHGRWGLVRIGTDGTVEYAGTPVAVINEFAPHTLPVR